jgi:magnesium-transporting ATPase (P-type)
MCVGAFLTVPILIIMETEAAFFSSFHLVFNNFTKFLLIPILVSLSRPADLQTPYRPCSNFLKKQNHLIVWGNIIISSAALAATVIFFRSTSEYVRNTRRADVNSGWTSHAHLVACQLLYFSLQPVIMIVGVYEGSPWKQPLYKNVVLFIVFLLNLAFQVAYYFIQPQLLSFFDVPSISY